MIDDSIVRGTDAATASCSMLREAGAKEVHMRDQLPAIPASVLFRYGRPGARAADRPQPFG